MGKKPAYLSGGQRQRVAIARALSHQPKLVFADEPTGSVDRPNAELIGQTLKDLAVQKNVGVVLVTHDIPLAEQYATRFYGFADLKKVRNQKTSTLLPC
jgi:ABC-type lipoprotein export system ATPase subunit